MAVVRTLGKNTLGDNNKMKVAMRDYDMSTHDISTVFRSSVGVGMLVPFCKILCQKGDIIDIDLINKTLSQPTLGPLFGSFKLQHFMFFGGFRLYNSWLHNNRTGIGMKMSDIKLPMMKAKTNGVPTTAKTEISTSALYKYLGWSESRRTGLSSNTGVVKNGVPLLLYIDIFKNFFANTQEEKFYMIKGGLSKISVGPNIYDVPVANINVSVSNTTTVGSFDQSDNWQDYWKNVKVTGTKDGTEKIMTMADLTDTPGNDTITLNKASTILTNITSIEFDKDIIKYTKSKLGQYDLKVLDQIRDVILHKKGNETLILTSSSVGVSENGSPELAKFIDDIIESQNNKLGGLLLKTYDSDIFNNWVKTDWIDGAGGITEITSIEARQYPRHHSQ